MSTIQKTENETLTTFVKFVTDKRTALGMSMGDLAEKVFGDRNRKSYISQLESGNRKGITIDVMNKILIELDSSINFAENN